MRHMLVCTVLLSGCAKALPAADPEFSDALAFLFRAYDDGDADLAFAMRDLEDRTYNDLDVDSADPKDRSLAPETLSKEDVADIERTNDDRALDRALPVAVAATSVHSVSRHAGLQMATDQTPVEPYSPDKYDRTLLEGADCWEAIDCSLLVTDNDLTKKNFLMEVDYQMPKEFRWVDLNLPDPSSVPEGEEPVNDGDPRWGVLGRSWIDKSYAGDNDNAYIHQSFTVELWIPRDDGGTLRLLALWSESELDGLNVGDDEVIATLRSGIEQNFNAADDYLSGDGG